MLFRSRIRQTIANGILVLFTLVLLNGIVFRHAHRLSNGQIITHAHPYKPVGNSPIQPNNHSDQELFLLDAFAHILFLSTTELSFAFLINIAISFNPSYFYLRPSYSQFIRFYSLRGPPNFRF
ncbi:hypothetical protein [Runella salmonicolor]|uniref:Uncharacterized protein n=1 Tax=Runella salmonicolor TaxID=2950278 RepID=A0ABT1FVU3_9BACT|nr:hypothetical protein [Runella salmonicolor]MCP1385826.1 hypothetical protein [Runella salmonicolor]